jgi:hypothetical protein
MTGQLQKTLKQCLNVWSGKPPLPPRPVTFELPSDYRGGRGGFPDMSVEDVQFVFTLADQSSLH